MSIKYSLAAGVFRSMYARYAKAPLQDRVVFLSRQGNAMSLDFQLLRAALADQLPGWEILDDCYRDSGGFGQRIKHSAGQLKLMAAARLVIVDGWNPAVSIPQLWEGTKVVQLWHAFGAVKQFGWQIVGKPGGRTREQAEQLRMHRNYDVVVAAGPGATEAFAAGFDLPPQRIKPWGVPLMDVLNGEVDAANAKRRLEQLRREYPALASSAVKVLYAPTFRKGAQGAAAAEQAVRELASALGDAGCELIMCPHPVFATREHPQNVTVVQGQRSAHLLGAVDYVVTDYSSVAYEAGFAGKPVLFYCPDIAEYRAENGLNMDPVAQFASIAFTQADGLAAWLGSAGARAAYADSGFPRYVEEYLGMPREHVTQQLARRIAELALG